MASSLDRLRPSPEAVVLCGEEGQSTGVLSNRGLARLAAMREAWGIPMRTRSFIALF